MQGSAAPAQLHISSTLDDDNNVTVVPHSQEGLWSGPHSYVLETSLADLLKAPAYECLRFDVIDNSGQRQGQALLPFRTAFSPTVDTSIPFKVSVTYSCVVDGEESGVSSFQNGCSRTSRISMEPFSQCHDSHNHEEKNMRVGQHALLITGDYKFGCGFSFPPTTHLTHQHKIAPHNA